MGSDGKRSQMCVLVVAVRVEGAESARGVALEPLNTLQTPQTKEARSEARTEGRSAGECVIVGWIGAL